MTRVLRAVKRVTQSPMNPLRWSLELVCGHEVWVTSKREPQRFNAPCEKCKASASEAREHG